MRQAYNANSLFEMQKRKILLAVHSDELLSQMIRAGHTIEQHVEMEDWQLAERIRSETMEGNAHGATTFFDIHAAKLAIRENIESNIKQIAKWTLENRTPRYVGEDMNRPFDSEHKDTIGKGFDMQCKEAYSAASTVVLQRDSRSPTGFIIYTAYPSLNKNLHREHVHETGYQTSDYMMSRDIAQLKPIEKIQVYLKEDLGLSDVHISKNKDQVRFMIIEGEDPRGFLRDENATGKEYFFYLHNDGTMAYSKKDRMQAKSIAISEKEAQEMCPDGYENLMDASAEYERISDIAEHLDQETREHTKEGVRVPYEQEYDDWYR